MKYSRLDEARPPGGVMFSFLPSSCVGATQQVVAIPFGIQAKQF